MHADQKQFLERRYAASEWHGRGEHRKHSFKELSFDGSELRGWVLERLQRDERGKPAVIRSLWRRGEGHELLAVDLYVCASVKAAHDQVLEALGNIESAAVERRTGKHEPGEVTFGLGETMVLFARANVVVLIRNAGPRVVPVGAAAREFDALLMRKSKAVDGAGPEAAGQ